ncbi:MAG: hypothetical protein R2911_22840 [Caldilineaceae bacterium]
MRDHCWPHFKAGNDPAQEPGVRLEIWDDDGSPEWADLYAVQGRTGARCAQLAVCRRE